MADNGPTRKDLARDHEIMAAADRTHAEDKVQAPTPAKREKFLKSALGHQKEAGKLHRA